MAAVATTSALRAVAESLAEACCLPRLGGTRQRAGARFSAHQQQLRNGSSIAMSTMAGIVRVSATPAMTRFQPQPHTMATLQNMARRGMHSVTAAQCKQGKSLVNLARMRFGAPARVPPTAGLSSSNVLSSANPLFLGGALFTRLPVMASSTKLRMISTSASLKQASRYTSNHGSSGSIDDLFMHADASPSNARAQADLLKALAKIEPQEVIARYESGDFAENDDCFKAYLQALTVSGKLWNHSVDRILDRILFSSSSSSSSYSSQSAKETDFGYGNSSGSGSGSGSYGSGSYGSHDEPLVVAVKEPSFAAQLWRLLRSVVMLVIIIYVAYGVLDETRGGGGPGVAGLGGTKKNKHEVVPESGQQVYGFEDVQGVDEAKEELEDVVSFLRDPEQFTRLGGKLPKGVLLMGPPGTGKTLLARAVAGEAGVPFFYASGSDFDEMYVGVGARRVRDLFAAAKAKSPCVIFLDEVDAVGGRRSSRDHQYSKMTLNQLLVELDGFKSSENVIVIAATNFPEMLDPALVRPGRFDVHIRVPLPDVRGREKILEVHSRKITLGEDVNLWELARGTSGFSGADLANVINQAALKASRDRHGAVSDADVQWAKDKIIMGAERKSAVMKPHDRKVTAYHEAGHALCVLYTDGTMPLYKATIMPRGNALGMVSQLPEDDVVSVTRKEMLARLVVCMGGLAAEEKIFGPENVTSGASSDLQSASNIARQMVMKYGMSEAIGPVAFDDEEKMSGSQRKIVDEEVKKLCSNAMEQAKKLLHDRATEHKRLAEALLEYETLTADDIRTVVKGKKLPPLKP